MMRKRLQKLYANNQEYLVGGALLGVTYIFLTLIGLPGDDSEALASLAVPIYLLIAFFLGWRIARPFEWTQLWHVVVHLAILGAAASGVFLLFLGLINNWQTENRINVSGDYFRQMNEYPMYILSGVPKDELFPNPSPDVITGEYPEGTILRTDPMKLYTTENYALVSLGFIHIGGFYGLAILIIGATVIGGVGEKAWKRIPWQTWRDNLQASIKGKPLEQWLNDGLHYLQLTLPLIFFLLFWLSVSQNTQIGFFESLGLDSKEPIQVLDLDAIGGGASGDLISRRSIQLGFCFLMVLTSLVAFQRAKSDQSQIPYVARALFLQVIVIVFALLAWWRMEAHNVTFLTPSRDFRLGDTLDGKTWGLVLLFLGVILASVYAWIANRRSDRFQISYAIILSGCVLLLSPLYMDTDISFTMVRIASLAMFGLGLNIVVGYAGLLDLGYVAFFAIGAYGFAFIAFGSSEFKLGSTPAWHNDIGWSVTTAIILTPILIMLSLLGWQRMQRTQYEKQPSETLLLSKVPIWRDRPPLLIVLGILILTIAATFFVQALMNAIGVYSVTLFSSFLISLIVAMLAGAFAGILLGFPVLRLRGDYLAIVTLGFGEIISLALNNLTDITGGPQGTFNIPKPFANASGLTGNLVFLYLGVIGTALVFMISIRLRNSRIGRAWLAIRSDEDIAQAMGINLVNLKLLAFSLGASFAALAGMFFASRQANIGPRDFSLEISINVLALVIIGGMGSLPGVIVGAIVLVGLPELLRPIQEYRILVFGLLLVLTMVSRPAGLMPSPPPSLEAEARRLAEAKGKAV